jgi:hypothetical protein
LEITIEPDSIQMYGCEESSHRQLASETWKVRTMVNYGYECHEWTRAEKDRLAEALKEVWADIEIDELYPGVRLRRLRHADRTPMSEKEIDELVGKADDIHARLTKELGKRNSNRVRCKFHPNLAKKAGHSKEWLKKWCGSPNKQCPICTTAKIKCDPVEPCWIEEWAQERATDHGTMHSIEAVIQHPHPETAVMNEAT